MRTVAMSEFGPVLREILAGSFADNPYATEYERLQWLARRCNVRENSLTKTLQRPEIDFDLADMILCKLNAVHMWRERLEFIYLRIELEPTCERDGCENTFTPLRGKQKKQRFCSDACRKAQELVDRKLARAAQ